MPRRCPGTDSETRAFRLLWDMDMCSPTSAKPSTVPGTVGTLMNTRLAHMSATMPMPTMTCLSALSARTPIGNVTSDCMKWFAENSRGREAIGHPIERARSAMNVSENLAVYRIPTTATVSQYASESLRTPRSVAPNRTRPAPPATSPPRSPAGAAAAEASPAAFPLASTWSVGSFQTTLRRRTIASAAGTKAAPKTTE